MFLGRRKTQRIKSIKRTKKHCKTNTIIKEIWRSRNVRRLWEARWTIKSHGILLYSYRLRPNKDKPLSKVINIDLSTDWGQKAFWRQIDEDTNVTTFAPPCGTPTRAREIRRKSDTDPKPVRTDESPDGIPTLNGLDTVFRQALVLKPCSRT